MIDWIYNEEEYIAAKEGGQLVPEGEHRVKIDKIKETFTKSSYKPMARLILRVSGMPGRVFHNIVFDHDNSSNTNRSLGELYAGFGIEPGSMNLDEWVGSVGIAKIVHSKYNGKTYANVDFFLPKEFDIENSPRQKTDNNIPF